MIPNNSILKDREFTNLSVTAEQWVDIEEVYSWNLISYLREIKKNSDYSLIGIEQSTESICLTDFSFPEKSLIVLGNEREGLPVEILQVRCFKKISNLFIKFNFFQSFLISDDGLLC